MRLTFPNMGGARSAKPYAAANDRLKNLAIGLDEGEELIRSLLTTRAMSPVMPMAVVFAP